MTIAASFLSGAKERVLPACIPFRFFAAAVIFHAASWLVLLIGADEAVAFSGGTGIGLAALHLLTVGVLATTAMGAALQLLPVATRQAIPARWPAKLGFWLIVPGTLALGHGAAASTIPLMILGGGLAAAGLAVLGVLIAVNLARARQLALVASHGWLAMVSLAALITLGLLLAFDFEAGFLARHRDLARVHLIVAGYGFMGMLVIGFSQILIPMYALSGAPDKRLGQAALWLSVLGLAVGVVGAAVGGRLLVSVALGLGLGATAAHLVAMARIMKTRMRKRLGLSFVLVRAAWVLLPLSLLLALLDIHDLLGDSGGTLFGFTLFAGWLLTMLLAILQRIMPFLASMHAIGEDGRPLKISDLTAETPLKISAVCHLAALVVAAAGIVAEQALVMRVGAAIGFVGALAFAWFTGTILRHLSSARRSEPAGAQAAS